MIDRRGALAAGAALPFALGIGAVAPLAAARLPAIGIQLYTVRELFAADPHATLRSVARLGYSEVEYGGGGYETMDHRALKRTMDGLGLSAPSIHLPYQRLVDDLPGAVRIARALGASTIIVPYIDEAQRAPAAWRPVVADFNRIAERLRRDEIGFAYHNHDFEFQGARGETMWDILLADGDRDLIDIELDIYWVVHAGLDPIATINALPGRIYAYHVKDRTADGTMTSVGRGTIDFASIFALNARAGARHFYVENDQSPAPYIPDIATSIMTLMALEY